MPAMITAPMLQLTSDAAEAVLILTDGLQRGDLLRSRLTRAEVQHQLQCLADTLEDAPDVLRHQMPEIDWAGWRATAQQLRAPRDAGDDALWFALRSLVPATLSWLRLYRRTEPALFAFRP